MSCNVGDETQAELAAALLGLRVDEPDAGLDEVTSAFNSVDIATSSLDISERYIAGAQNLHELHFDIPATELLPADRVPFLHPPEKIEVRECPRLMTGVDTSFYTRLATDSIASSSEVPALDLDGNDVVSLAEHMTRLHSAPGVSTLAFVQFEEDSFIQCRAKLTTTWQTAQGDSSETKTFTLYEHEWSDLQDCYGEEEWPSIVDHILHRRSDRAYIHVHTRLLALDIDLALTDLAQWRDVWDSGQMYSANQLLAHRIAWQDSSEGTLPCGHTQPVVPVKAIYDMPELDAQEFACETCDAYVLTEEDYQQVLNLYDRRHRVQFRIDEQCWKALKKKALSAEDRTFQVTHHELRTVFYEVAATFREPETLVPDFMNLADCDETVLLINHLNRIFCNGAATVTIDTSAAPEAFLDMLLEKLCDDAGLGPREDVTSVLPVGFEAFLHQWVQRIFLCLKTKDAHREDELADKLMGMMMDNGKSGGGKRRGPEKEGQGAQDSGPQCFHLH